MPQTNPPGVPGYTDPVLLLQNGEAEVRSGLLSLLTLGTSGAVLATSVLSAQGWLHRGLRLMGSVLLATSLLLGAIHLLQMARQNLARRTAVRFVRSDPSDCCLSDAGGRILARAPETPDPTQAPGTVVEALRPLVADAEGLVRRLQSEALRAGWAEADVSTRWGPQRLTVQRIALGTLFWRGKALGDSSPPGSPKADDWHTIEELPLTLIKLAPSGVVLAANDQARALLPVRIREGTRLSDLLEGLGRPLAEWIADVAEGRAGSRPQFLRGTGDH